MSKYSKRTPLKPPQTDAAIRALLRVVIEENQPLPSYPTIGTRIGVSSDTARASVRRLLARRCITVVIDSLPRRRKIVVHGVGETGWSTPGISAAKFERALNGPAMEVMTPDKDPWPAGCFEAHNLRMKDSGGRFITPPTHVPTRSVLG